MATIFVLESIQFRTGFAEDVLSFVIESIAEAASAEWLDDQAEIQEHPDTEWDMTQWIRISGLDEMTSALFENARLLRDVFAAVNSFLVCGGSPKRLSGEKRAALVLMLFRAFRATDKVDPDVVEDSINLAAN